jgi:hypothetical protein
MRCPAARSAWRSIQRPTAARSWLAVSFIDTRMSAWESTSLCSTAGRWVISHGTKPRTRPRRTISSTLPSSSWPSGPMRCGAHRSASSSTRCRGSALLSCSAPVNAVMNARLLAALPRSDTSTTQASAWVPTSRPSASPMPGGKGHVGVRAAEHHHRVRAGGAAVRGGAQAPPHPERVGDADPGAAVHQPLDQTLGGVGLARPRGAHDGQALVQRRQGQHARDPLVTPPVRVLRPSGSGRPRKRTMGGHHAADGGLAHPVAAGHLRGIVPAGQHLAGDSLRDHRDRALIALGMAAALRRSGLAALRVEDLARDTQGLRIRIARSETDQQGAGQVVAVPHGRRLRPVALLDAWLRRPASPKARCSGASSAAPTICPTQPWTTPAWRSWSRGARRPPGSTRPGSAATACAAAS